MALRKYFFVLCLALMVNGAYAKGDMIILALADTTLNGAITDAENIISTYRYLGQNADMNVSFALVNSTNLTGIKLREQIEQMTDTLSTEDIVVFFFAGHGVNNGQSPWPRILLGDGRSSSAVEASVSFEMLAHSLLEKTTPRLLIAMADCCNNLVPSPIQGEILSSRGPVDAPANLEFLPLILNSKGTVFSCSSEPNQTSWGGETGGGIFTQSICSNFKNAAATTSWGTLLQQIADSTTAKAAFADKVQHPMYEAHINGEEINSWDKPEVTSSTKAEEAYANFAEEKVYTLTRRIKTVSDPQTPYSTAKNIFGTIHNELFDNKNTTIGVSSIKNPQGNMRSLDSYLKNLRGLYEGKNAKYDEISLEAVIEHVGPLREVQQGTLWKGEITFKQTFIGKRDHAIRYADITEKTTEVFIRFEQGQPVVYLGKIPVKNTKPYHGK